MKPEVFLDTGIFIAWLVREELSHPRAAELFSNLPPLVATSLAVVSEAYGWFLQRFDEDRARTFRLSLHELPVELLSLDKAHHSAVERKLENSVSIEGAKLLPEDLF